MAMYEADWKCSLQRARGHLYAAMVSIDNALAVRIHPLERGPQGDVADTAEHLEDAGDDIARALADVALGK